VSKQVKFKLDIKPVKPEEEKLGIMTGTAGISIPGVDAATGFFSDYIFGTVSSLWRRWTRTKEEDKISGDFYFDERSVIETQKFLNECKATGCVFYIKWFRTQLFGLLGPKIHIAFDDEENLIKFLKMYNQKDYINP
jgi:hypothetical protein